VKLRHLDAWNKARRGVASLYDRLLPDEVIKPTATNDVEPVWHVYAIQVEQRDRVAAFLDEKGIGTGVHYPLPVHRQTALRGLGYEVGSHPIAEAASSRLLSLPIYPELTPSSVRVVAGAVHDFFEPPSQPRRRDEDARRVASLGGAKTTREGARR
jgi:dTDP-4-amino-4,6-dideoxygalactose transaminase